MGKYVRIEKDTKINWGQYAYISIGLFGGLAGWKVSGDILSFFKSDKKPFTNLGLTLVQFYCANMVANELYSSTKELVTACKNSYKSAVKKEEVEEDGNG